jgi:ParB-like chromosome segregation protein Spo0J
MENPKLEIIEVSIKELKPAEYNPREMTEEETEELNESLERFGMVEPIVVNKAAGRENVIIGGHQRYELIKCLC